MTPPAALRSSPVPLALGTLDADLDTSLAHLRATLGGPACRIAVSRARVEAALSDGRAHYGVNTGFGALKSVRVGPDALAELQVNLLLSHAVGVGPPVAPEVSRRMLRLKLHALSLGVSGVSLPVVERLLAMEAAGVIPVVPSQGSLGASGDLAPLAHLVLPLIGRGHVWRDADDASAGTEPAADALARHGWAPVALGPKDGLALINGTQFMAAVGGLAVERALRLADTADVAAAMTLEAIRGSSAPFDARVHAVRPHPGAAAVAGRIRALLAGSEIGPSHAGCDKVQDPYSVRCVPPVHGASRDALAYAARAVEIEANSVTDNPLVFEGAAGNVDVVSAGLFHGQPLALPFDTAAIATAELASISERRTYLLLDGHDALPPFLLVETGAQSGFMMAQYTAAALVSENKTLCHPASVDTIPSSRGQEDHVSMGAWGARKLAAVVENAERVLAVEVLCAAQALDFRLPLRPGRGVRAAWEAVRATVPYRTADGEFGEDLDACLALVRSGALSRRA